jgi:nitrate reductase NapAB chaperone NapD
MNQRMDNLKSKITTIKNDIADIIIECINKNDYTITLKSLMHPNDSMLNGKLVVVDSGDDAEVVFDTEMNITTIGYVVDIALEVYKIMLTHETYECEDAIRDVLQSKIINKIIIKVR